MNKELTLNKQIEGLSSEYIDDVPEEFTLRLLELFVATVEKLQNRYLIAHDQGEQEPIIEFLSGYDSLEELKKQIQK